MVVYLPIAILKNWICSFLNKDLLKLCNNDSIMSSSSDLDVPLRINELQQGPTSDKDLREREEGQPFNSRNEEDEPQLLEYDVEPNSWEIAKCSFYLAPIWFTTEFFSNSALANTSVASTTVLTSTSGLFTLFFGALLGHDSINFGKVVAVFISMAGVAMTAFGKTWASDEMLNISESRQHSIMGDIFGLISAMTSGLFTVLLKKSAGSGDKVDVQKFFGYIGLFALFGLWWLGLFLWFGQLRWLQHWVYR